MSYTVTILDTGGIQNYIFGSNELRENIGASELVYRATRDWVFEGLEQLLSGAHNINITRQSDGKASYEYDKTFKIEEQGSEAAVEVLYAGGGNTVILFGGANHEQRARTFTYNLSRRVLQDAPGLNIYAAHERYEWGADPGLPQTVQTVLERLGQLKGELPGALPALGLGVTAACTSTGLPANGAHPDKDKRGTLANVSNRQVPPKWRAAEEATARLRSMFTEVEEASFLWTDDLDRLAKVRERDSYIAVVHADGNGMGRRIQNFNKAWEEHPDRPRDYIKAMRDLSQQIEGTATEALKSTIAALVKQLQTEEGQERYHAPYFPFRPIVFGGDDVTWVSAGPWGVTLAHRYLAELEKKKISERLPDGEAEGAAPYACAGVAIVKTHYPFSRAYDLSGELAGSAKALVRSMTDDKQASGLDWHYTTTGLTGSLRQIRQREYRSDDGGRLHMRPIMLDEQYGWRNWANFNRIVMAFAYNWLDRRNKVMAVREALRKGRPAVQQFELLYGEQLPEPELSVSGWVDEADEKEGARCSHFDAVELIDMYFDLPARQEEAAA